MTTVNITVANDADFYRAFTWETILGVPVDMTGMSLEMMLRRHAKDEAAVLRLATDTGEFELIDPVNGKFTLRITQAALVRLGLGDFEQSNIATLNGSKTRIWSGMFTNNAGPTR